jgi:Transposase DDE domain
VGADWKAAIGVDDDFTGIAARTFSLMRARMMARDADNELFKATLAKAVQAGIFKGRLTAIIDSSPVNGAGAVADSYELIRGFLRQAVRAAGDGLSRSARAAAAPFCGPKPDIDWQDPQARREHLGVLVGAARTVMAELDGVTDPAVAEPVGLLAQVIEADTEPDPDDGGDGGLRLREGVAPDRVISVSDPQMRHGRKSSARRFDGHKMDVITDEASELVLGVDIRAGNAGDGEGAAGLLDQVQHHPGVEINTLLGDMAYSDGDVRQAVAERGVELIAKVPPLTNGGYYPKTDFYIDLPRGEVTCPAGEVTTDAQPATDHKRRPVLRFHFSRHSCATCPLRPECTAAAARTVTVGVHHARIEAVRAAQRTPKIAALLRRRAKVERRIDHLQDLGMRKARYRGRRKTKLQAFLAATVANFKRLALLGAFAAAPEPAVAA